MTEYTRDSKKWAVGLELKNACANFDLAVKFFEKHAAMLARAPCPRSRRNKGTRATPLAIVYHGTSRSNFRAIMEGNLKVPDGRAVKHVTDDGFFGRGIYTTTDPRLAFAYAKDAIVFCLSGAAGAPVQGHAEARPGRAKKAGYDSHLGYVLRGVREVHSTDAGCRDDVEASRRWRHSIRRRATARPQLVFFDTDQVLPLPRRPAEPHAGARRPGARRESGGGKTGNARPSDGIPKNRSGRRAMPAPGACAAGAGTPVAPGVRAAAADGRRDAARPRRVHR